VLAAAFVTAAAMASDRASKEFFSFVMEIFPLYTKN
jgi:hypothetical protein